MSAAIKPNHDHKRGEEQGGSEYELVRKKRVAVNGNFVVFELQIVLLHLATSVCECVCGCHTKKCLYLCVHGFTPTSPQPPEPPQLTCLPEYFL